MPERLNRVAGEAGGRTVRISWGTRDALLDRLGESSGAGGIVDAFRAVGATRPVELDAQQKATLLRCLDVWWHAVTTPALPEGAHELRAALADELRR